MSADLLGGKPNQDTPARIRLAMERVITTSLVTL